MNLIEKKCPNCGANLEFNENDKSCKCQYCHREFEIKRDSNNYNEFSLITTELANEIQKEVLNSFKINKYIQKIFFTIFFIAFITIIIIFIKIIINN